MTIDPTKNVLDLVAAAISRQDDLRTMNATHLETMMDLRANYDEKLRIAEADRLDSIRSVDRDTVARAADVQATAATTLAAQVASSADAVRVTLDAKVAPILEAIAALQRAQYETAGGKTQEQETGLSSRAWATIIVGVFGLVSTVLLGVLGVVVTLILKK